VFIVIVMILFNFVVFPLSLCMICLQQCISYFNIAMFVRCRGLILWGEHFCLFFMPYLFYHFPTLCWEKSFKRKLSSINKFVQDVGFGTTF